jgi:hypothetical protein
MNIRNPLELRPVLEDGQDMTGQVGRKLCLDENFDILQS